MIKVTQMQKWYLPCTFDTMKLLKMYTGGAAFAPAKMRTYITNSSSLIGWIGLATKQSCIVRFVWIPVHI